VTRSNDIPEGCQWATFLRNHDELTLSSLTEEQQTALLARCAPEPMMRLHGGIRRRLAPLLGNQRDLIELAFTLLLSLPGSPVLYYGDEIGMGDDVRLQDRDGLRTPMQWSHDRNAGFSNAAANELVAPVINDEAYGYQVVNVTNQERDRDSLLSRVRRLIHARRQHAAFGRGSIDFLPTGSRSVLAFVRRYLDDEVLIVVNLSASTQSVTLNLPPSMIGTGIVNVADGVALTPATSSAYTMTLGPRGSYWLACVGSGEAAPAGQVV
jgi:maltose alpha-D-glucosyltransferase/alpha-amylase